MEYAFKNALVLTGPTGSGKTAVSLELAERLNAEIIALDSMTVYKGLDIGTAKPTRDEQARVKHHLIDVLEPQESANVAWWLERAKVACDDIRHRGKRPLFVGGTPFYLKALLHGLFESPPVDAGVRRRLEAEAAAIGPEAFHAKLAAVDALAAAKIHANNVRRVVRALEVFESTGERISELQQTWDQPPQVIPTVMLEWPKEVLNQRIDQRVTLMMDAGWLTECERLMTRPMSKEAMQAVGYSVLFVFLGECRGVSPTWSGSEDTSGLARQDTSGLRLDARLIDLIRLRTRQFAKRQLTWFRSLPVTPVAADAPDLAERIVDAWSKPIRSLKKS